MAARRSSLTSLWILLGGMASFVLAMGLFVLFMSGNVQFTFEGALGHVGLAFIGLGYLIVFFSIIFAIPLAIVAWVAHREKTKANASGSGRKP